MKLIKINKESGIPLIGLVYIGCVDRGSSLIQVRPTSICNLRCIFCATASNDSNKHPVEFETELNYLLEWVKCLIKEKKEDSIEVNLDSAGEVLCYDKIIELVKELRKIKEIRRISMQSNGVLLDKEKIKELEKAGLDQINFSLHSLNEKKNKILSGCSNYNTKEILEKVRLVNNSKIELLIAPVWLPKYNDEDIEEIIKLCKKLNCKIGIQKYERHKHGRKAKGVKEITYYKFYKQLEEWEKKFGIKLKLGPSDFGIRRTKKLPLVFKKNEIIHVEIKAEGWFNGELIGVAKNRSISVLNSNKNIGEMVKVKIIRNKDEIYLAKAIN